MEKSVSRQPLQPLSICSPSRPQRARSFPPDHRNRDKGMGTREFRPIPLSSIPLSLHSPVPSFPCPFIPLSLHSPVPSFPCPFIPLSLHSPVPPFPCPSIPLSFIPLPFPPDSSFPVGETADRVFRTLHPDEMSDGGSSLSSSPPPPKDSRQKNGGQRNPILLPFLHLPTRTGLISAKRPLAPHGPRRSLVAVFQRSTNARICAHL